MAKTVLVTGCAGFIGSHVSEALLKRGDTVIGIDEINDYYPIKNKERNLAILQKYDAFTFHKISFDKIEHVKPVFDNHSITDVIHIGARAGVRPSIVDPLLYVHTNFVGTANILQVAKESGVKNFVITSSSSIYGNNPNTPWVEDDPITSKPVSPYAATKKSVEVLAHSYHENFGVNITIVRPFTVYGPRGRPDMFPWIAIERAVKEKEITQFGDGTTSRDYTYIDDLVKGFVSALDKPAGYEIFNLGNNQSVTLTEFLNTVREVTGKKLNLKIASKFNGDVDHTYADISKAKRLLGYEPKTTIKEGLTKFYEWYSETHLKTD